MTPFQDKLLWWAATVGTVLCTAGVVLLLAAAYFPEFFESRGIYIFHNQKGGVFAECFAPSGEVDEDCRNKRGIELGIYEPPNRKSVLDRDFRDIDSTKKAAFQMHSYR